MGQHLSSRGLLPASVLPLGLTALLPLAAMLPRHLWTLAAPTGPQGEPCWCLGPAPSPLIQTVHFLMPIALSQGPSSTLSLRAQLGVFGSEAILGLGLFLLQTVTGISVREGVILFLLELKVFRDRSPARCCWEGGWWWMARRAAPGVSPHAPAPTHCIVLGISSVFKPFCVEVI